MISMEEENALFLNLFDSSVSNVFTPSDYQIQQNVKSMLEENKGLLINPNEINENTVEKFKLTLEEFKKLGFELKGKMIAFKLPSDYYLNGQELKYLMEIEEILKRNNAELVLKEGDLFYLDDIIATNERLDVEIDYINSLTVPTENNRPLNQFEKFLLAYDFCTNFKYNECEENKSKSRYLTSILNSDKIVCVGYAKLLTEMCRRLGIECHSLGVSCFDKITKETEGHENNIVVFDSKMYYADACWDSQMKGDKGLKLYNHCLIPLEDRKHIKDIDVKYNEFNNLPYAKEDLPKAKKLLKEIINDEISYKEAQDLIWKYPDIVTKVKVQMVYDENLTFEEMHNRHVKKKEIEKLKAIIKYLEKHQEGEPIPYYEFEEALLNIYLAKGMSEKVALNLLTRTLEFNKKRAQKCFDNNAQNCFVEARTKELGI